MFLGEVQGFVGTPDNVGRHVHRRDGGEADRASDLPDLRKFVVLDRDAEPVEARCRQLLVGSVEDDDEFLAAKTEQAVAAAEGLAHEFAHAQQDFVAEQVTERVVHALEVIDVDHAQPGRRSILRIPAPIGEAPFGAVGRLRRKQPIEGFVKGLAVEQARQRIELAVIEQFDLAAVDARETGDLFGVARRIVPADVVGENHLLIRQFGCMERHRAAAPPFDRARKHLATDRHGLDEIAPSGQLRIVDRATGDGSQGSVARRTAHEDPDIGRLAKQGDRRLGQGAMQPTAIPARGYRFNALEQGQHVRHSRKDTGKPGRQRLRG